MKRINLALLYGGDSSEREISIMSWRKVRESLDQSKYKLFHYDMKNDLKKLMADASHLDAAFICLHGRGGEDGTLQGFLEFVGIPYQGCGILASALAMNKRISKELFIGAGLTVPQCLTVTKDKPLETDQIKLTLPYIVKPVHEGSSVGLCIVEQAENLDEALEEAFRYDNEVILEEYVRGTEVTGAVLGLDRPEALPLVEIHPKSDHSLFDFSSKYDSSKADEICPARLSPELTSAAQKAALTAHKVLDCRGYSRTDMIIREETVFVLETNTLPGMTDTSLLPKAARQAGMDFSELLDTLISMSFESLNKR